MTTWNEAEHPRDDEGKFTYKNGGVLNRESKGDFEGAANEFDKYIHQRNKKTGKYEVLNGLIDRRAKEKKLFFTPDDY